MPGKFSLGPGQKFTVSSFGIFTSLLQSSPQFLVQGLCSRWGLRSAVQGLGCWVSLHLWAAILGPGFAYLAVFSMGRARRPSGSHLWPWRWVCAWPTCSTLLWPRARGLSLWATWVAVCHAWEQPPLQALLHVRRTPDQQHTGPPDQLKAALSAQIQNLSWNLSDRQQYLPWVWSTLCSKHLNVLAAQVMSEDVLVSSAASSAVLERGRRGDCRSRKFC